jgi:Zn-dependent protease
MIVTVLNIVITIAVFIIVIVAHEFAHGYAAYKMGDNTAKQAGRLTLNPIKHLDLVGTIILPAVLMLMGSPVIGWAKPVPVNPYNFKNPRKGMFLTSLAGPGANFCLALVFAAILKLDLVSSGSLGGVFLLSGLYISLILGIFNMMPIPPLDGANIVASILPPRYAQTFMRIERYGFIIILGLLYLGVFNKVLIPILKVLVRLLVGGG